MDVSLAGGQAPAATAAPGRHAAGRAAAGDRIRFLDVLRATAAVAVLLQHALERAGSAGQAFVNAVSPGVFGVVLFFVISGFAMPMASGGGTSGGGGFAPRRFVLRRVLRIYPLVLAAFAAVALAGMSGLLPDFAGAAGASAATWIANLLLIQDYVQAEPLLGVTWTLSLEIAWYALFAAGTIWLGRRFDDRLVLWAPVVMLILLAASLGAGHRLPLARIGMLYAAILGCRAWRQVAGELAARRLAIDACVFLLVMTACNLVSFGYFRHPNITLAQAALPWITAPLLFLAVSTVAALRASKLFANRALAWLGMVSFSTYLLHPFAIAIAHTYCARDFLLASFGLTLLFSLAGYHLVEAPGQALGRWLTR